MTAFARFSKAARLNSFSSEINLARQEIIGRSKILSETTAGKKKTENQILELPVKYGFWRTDVHWDFDPTTTEDVLAGHLAFYPNPARAPICESIRIIQAAQVEISPANQFQWEGAETDRNLTRTKDGFFIDHEAANCSEGAPCSPYYRDSWSLPDESQDGYNLPDKTAKSSIADYPFGWTMFNQIMLETCARCVDSGQFLGCVEWGAHWPRIGNRPPPFTPVASDNPPIYFLNALRRFNAFYGNP
ncbi:MAG: hypothetical protein ACYCPQ_07510 [Elusimicrobiota bacterium]